MIYGKILTLYMILSFTMLIKNTFYKELVGNSARILTILVIILPVTELFKLLEKASAGNLPTVTIFTLMLYGTLASFPMVLNIASFLGITITMNRFSKDHELSIWLASGVSPFYWLKQTFIFLIPIMIFCGASSMVITPWAVHKSEEYAKFLTKQAAPMALTPGQFRESPDGKNVYYVERYSLGQGYAKNIFVQYTDNDGTAYNITADEGKITNHEGMIGLTLFDGNRYQINNFDKGQAIDLHFKTFTATFAQAYDPDKDKVALGNSSRNMSILWSLYDSDSNSRREISKRLSIMLMTLVMGLIAIPISMQTSRVQGNLVFILPPLIYGVYQNLVLTIESQISSGKLYSILWVIPIHLLLIAFAIGLTYVKSKPNGYFRSKNK